MLFPQLKLLSDTRYVFEGVEYGDQIAESLSGSIICVDDDA
jgi:hypothetical protein